MNATRLLPRRLRREDEPAPLRPGSAEAAAASRPAAEAGSPLDLRDRPGDAPPASEAATGVPGADADKPTDIPKRGWLQITKRAWAESKKDQVPLLAAGVAFYSFLAIFPAIIGAVLVYGLVADPGQVVSQVENFARALPADAQSLLTEQLQSLAGGQQQALGIGLAIALLAALWSASGGMAGLLKALSVCYDEEESRGFVKLRGLSLALTFGAILFFVVAIGLVAVLPAIFDAVGLGTIGRLAAEVLRWGGLFAAVMAALALIYRYGPDRDAPKLRWTSTGAVVATVLWLLGSLGFSLYVDNFGSYAKTYGALAGVVVLLLWLFLTSFVVLLGAEINAEAEQQTARDTTTGPEQPMGQRNAVKADTLPGS